MTARSTLRRAWPWLLGAAITVAVALRLPYAAFAAAVQRGPHARLIAVDAVVLAAVLAADTLATRLTLAVCGVRWTIARTLVVRGATYLLSLLNYAAGQGGLGYYIHEDGVPTARAAGITLFTIGTTFATLLAMTTGAWRLGGYAIPPAMAWTLVAGCAGFVLYLVVIAARPAAFIGPGRRELLAPLFDAGVRGHCAAVLGRLPHVALISFGHWFALLAWGIDVPFSVAATAMPIVVIIGALPISPGGLGTTQGALVYFFAAYAPGETADARAAALFAFAIVHFVYAVAGQAFIGLVCLAVKRRARPPRAGSPARA